MSEAISPPAVESVNVGRPRRQEWGGRTHRSAAPRSTHDGPIWVGELGLEGDQVADRRFHGGRDQAVYAFAREDLDAWAEELGRPVPPGMFGENLTTRGLDLNEAVIGEKWRVGDAVLEVASARIPCSKFAGWLGEQGYDTARWVKRFTAAGRPGPYLRVREEGAVTVGDPLEVLERPEHGVTVATMFRAMTTDRSLLPRLRVIDGLAEGPAEALRCYEEKNG